MITENLSTLKIHKLTQAQYDRELEAGRIDESALYLTPDTLFSYTETDPTVPAWAKTATKPTYTASEIGADASGTASSAVSAHNAATDAHADIREQIIQLSSEKEALTEKINEIEEDVIDIKAESLQQVPLFANSIEECTDTSKLYVLPDGYIYAYMYSDGAATYTNLALPLSDGWQSGYRINANGAVVSSSESGAFVSNIFTCKTGDVLRIKGVTGSSKGTGTSAYFRFQPLNVGGATLSSATAYLINPPTSVATGKYCVGSLVSVEDGVYTYTIMEITEGTYDYASSIAKGRISGILAGTAEDVIITINEEITSSEGGYQWMNTGHAFVPADYEDRITVLEESQTAANERIALIEEELAGKEDASGSLVKWCAMGDSITQGWVSYLNNGTPTSKVDSASGWAAKLADLNSWDLTNNAIGGTGFIDLENSDTQGVTAAWYIARNTDFKPYNLVTLAYGINDWKGNIPLGAIDDAIDTPTTIYGGMKATIEAIMDSNPLCKIIVLTPLNCAGYNFDYGTEATNWGLSKSFSNNGTLEAVFQAMVNVCEYYGIEYVDMTHKSVVNRKNLLSCLTDGVHPNAEAHTLLAYELAKKLNFVG